MASGKMIISGDEEHTFGNVEIDMKGNGITTRDLGIF
jgi:hypothetical protein